MNWKSFTQSLSGLAILVVAVVCANIIASKLSVRLDVTEDKVYSLSEGTEKILEGLSDEIEVKLYFSRSLKELPIIVKQYATRVEEVLNEYSAKSGGKIQLGVIDPKPDTDEEEWARKYGIQGARLPNGDQMYFGLVFIKGSKEAVLPYLDPRREEFLEYDLTETIVGLFKETKDRIGIMSSLPVMGPPGGHFGMDGPSWVFVTDLQRNFEVVRLEPNAKSIDPSLKVLLIIHPKDLPAETSFAIDQYLLGGGRLIVAVDPMSRIDMASQSQQQMMMGQMPQMSSDMPELFKAWDLEYMAGKLVGDTRLGTRINAGGMPVDYPFFMTLQDGQFATTSVVTSSLQQMMLGEPGSLSQKPDSAYSFDPLIETTEASGEVEAALAGMMGPQDLSSQLKEDKKRRTIAALIRGRFKSAFPAGPPAGVEAASPHLTEAKGEVSVIVVADVDFLADANSVDKFRFGSQTMVRVRNDNLNFLFNSTDFLGGSEELISIRSRGRVARPFDKVAEIQRNAQAKWKEEEEKLSAELQELQAKLNELQEQRADGNRFVLTDQQQSEIEKFREREREVRKRRRIVRKNLREDIERLGNRLVAINLLFVPILVSGFGWGVFYARNRRMNKEKGHA